MPVILSISVGAVFGALARHYLGAGLMKLSPNALWSTLWGTLAVNILGCLIIGLFAGLLMESSAFKTSISTELRAFIAVGFLGSFTTFSTFALDIAYLTQRGAWGEAVLYFCASTILSVAALFTGIAAIKYCAGA